MSQVSLQYHTNAFVRLFLFPLLQFPLVLNNLLAPAGSLLAPYSVSWCRCAYYRLGKKRPSSGILSRYSRLAPSIQTEPTMPTSAVPIIKVLAFQFPGWAYQPPAGDQTCFGYLDSDRSKYARSRALVCFAYGIFPPPPIVNRVVVVVVVRVAGALG